jgi:hypothetical protein
MESYMSEDQAAIRQKIDTDPDYIATKRYGNSLKRLLERYPNGVGDDEKGIKIMAQALKMTEEEVRASLAVLVKGLRRRMGVLS